MNVVIGTLCFVAGAVAVYLYQKTLAGNIIREAEEKKKSIIDNATLESRNIIQDAKLKAKEEIEKRRSEFEEEMRKRRSELGEKEKQLAAKESRLEQKQEELEEKNSRLEREMGALEDKRRELERMVEEETRILERISSMSKEEAREQLLNRMDEELENEYAVKIREYENRFRETAKKRATSIIADALQRCSVDYNAEALVSVVTLPNDEMKGRIIGRDGRNIRAFEQLTGIDVIVDDTPEAVVLSGFNVIKREIARMTMEKLIIDGRIHPAKIEQVLEQSQRELYENIKEIGEHTVMQLGIRNLHDKLVFEIGKLRYRTSYGQNVLEHSIEVAKLAALMANEIGANAEIAKRAGLLHDIGKVSDVDDEGSHAIVGMQLAKKLGEKPEVVNAIGAHHEEIAPLYVESILVQVADTLSASRPGARRETLESYIKRLNDLESIAKHFKGVCDAYAIQAGREIRVLVKPNEVDDDMATVLAKDIVKKIENEIQYPGQVKVVVIRETRAVEIAH